MGQHEDPEELHGGLQHTQMSTVPYSTHHSVTLHTIPHTVYEL